MTTVDLAVSNIEPSFAHSYISVIASGNFGYIVNSISRSVEGYSIVQTVLAETLSYEEYIGD